MRKARRAGLVAADLSAMDLSCANLSGATMRGAVLTSVQMEPVVRHQDAGKGAKLVRRDLSQSDLTGATV
jgi:uncharacterized protein YjbI with pentapeptide repeats